MTASARKAKSIDQQPDKTSGDRDTKHMGMHSLLVAWKILLERRGHSAEGETPSVEHQQTPEKVVS